MFKQQRKHILQKENSDNRHAVETSGNLNIPSLQRKLSAEFLQRTVGNQTLSKVVQQVNAASGLLQRANRKSINIHHAVNLFPQPTSMTCWSAAATMVLGNQSIGPGGGKLGPTGGLQLGSVQDFARSYGLIVNHGQSYTVEALANLLQHGPLWVGGAIPSGHAYVIGGMQGDGTLRNTRIHIYDPWPPNRGRIYWVNYSRWMRSYPLATMFILHH